MVKLAISDLIIQLHDLARQQPDHKTNNAIRKIADDLARVGNEQVEDLLATAEMMSDKGYELSTHEKQEEFMKKRNYNYKDIGDCV
jgi:hypothetical protein